MGNLFFNGLQHGGGGGLFGGPTRSADATLFKAQFGNFAGHIKTLLVRRTHGADHAVLGQGHFARLQPFLELGFGVFTDCGHLRIDVNGRKKLAHQSLGDDKTSIQIDRANDRFQCVGQDGGALAAARAHFAVTQPQKRRQPQIDGQLVQGFLAHQVGAYAGQIALGQGLQLRVQKVRDRQAEHRIAQKLQPFVMVGGKTTVGQRLHQQIGPRKDMAQALLKRLQRRSQAHGVGTDGVNGRRRYA